MAGLRHFSRLLGTGTSCLVPGPGVTGQGIPKCKNPLEKVVGMEVGFGLVGVHVKDTFSQFSRSVMSDSCDPMNCSTPGLPVHHQLLESIETYVH